MNTQPRDRTGSILALAAILTFIMVVVAAALAFNMLKELLIGFVGICIIGLVLAWISSKNIAVPLIDAQTKREELRYNFLLGMAKNGALPANGEFYPRNQIEAPHEEVRQVEAPIDPRHELLVSLCILTIKDDRYGPTSCKLMSANDAQADRSGIFADRMNWDSASKYGQSVLGLLYAKTGGMPQEQGLRIKGSNGTDGTAADLLIALHKRGKLDAAFFALPEAQK